MLVFACVILPVLSASAAVLPQLQAPQLQGALFSSAVSVFASLTGEEPESMELLVYIDVHTPTVRAPLVLSF